MPKSKTYRDYIPEQKYLLPPDVRDWLPSGDLVYFIEDVVSELDLSEIHASYDGSLGGRPPYAPLLMVRLLVYSYCIGLTSSRKIEQATYYQIPFRVLCGGLNPDHDTICSFRKRHLESLSGLFCDVLRLCYEAGLVKLGHVSLDGSKVKANASKHKAMSYSRMKMDIERLEGEILEWFEKADSVDAEEDRKYGKGNQGDDIPQELHRRETRLKKIREAKAKLESDALAAAEAEEAQRRLEEEKEKKSGGKKRRGPKKKISREPSAKAQYNFTDPESRIMRDGASKSFEQSYNCQIAVDSCSQVIVAPHVTQAANDKQQLEPVLDKLESNTAGQLPAKLSADSGYFSENNINYLVSKGVDAYIATGRMKHNQKKSTCPRGRIAANATLKERMARKLKTKRGSKVYSARKYIVEPVFGQIKEARGFRRFSLRGYENVQWEWDFICLTHNLLKLFRSGIRFGYSKG